MAGNKIKKKRKKRGGQKFGLKNEYKKSWEFLKGSKNFIYLVVGIFFVFAILGFFVPAPGFISDYIKTYVEQLVNETQGMGQLNLITFIFLNNAKTSFFGIILGVFLGVFPIISSIINGYLVGFVSSIAVGEAGGGVLWKLLPHGIFELPAVFISLGMGFKLGTFIFKKDELKSFKEYFWNSLRVFLFIVIPLLVIAAIIEGSLIFLGK